MLRPPVQFLVMVEFFLFFFLSLSFFFFFFSFLSFLFFFFFFFSMEISGFESQYFKSLLSQNIES